jgi:hypothetical protein
MKHNSVDEINEEKEMSGDECSIQGIGRKT